MYARGFRAAPGHSRDAPASLSPCQRLLSSCPSPVARLRRLTFVLRRFTSARPLVASVVSSRPRDSARRHFSVVPRSLSLVRPRLSPHTPDRAAGPDRTFVLRRHTYVSPGVAHVRYPDHFRSISQHFRKSGAHLPPIHLHGVRAARQGVCRTAPLVRCATRSRIRSSGATTPSMRFDDSVLWMTAFSRSASRTCGGLWVRFPPPAHGASGLLPPVFRVRERSPVIVRLQHA